MRRFLLIVLAAFLAGAALSPAIVPRFASRSIVFEIDAPAAHAVAVRWTPVDESILANGFWIDFDDDVVNDARPLRVQHTLPDYALCDIHLEPDHPSPMVVGTAKVYTFLTGVRLPTRTLTFAGGAFGGLPSLARATGWRGVLFSGGLGAVVGALGFGAVRAGSVLHRALSSDGTRGPSPRWLTPLTLGVCVAAPCVLLGTPAFLLADSTAYLWSAQLINATHALAHFDGWRLPGYSLLLAPFLSLFVNYAPAVAAFQALLAAVTSLLVFDALRRRVAHPWPHVAALLVALDPVLLGWTRVVMAETASAFTLTLAGWVYLRMIEPRVSGRRVLMLGLALGGTCAAACWLRGNNLILPALLIPGLVAGGIALRRRCIAVSALPAALVLGALLLPLALLNVRNSHRFALTIGNNFNRALFSWENGTTDWNQCGTLSLMEFRDLRTRLRTQPMTDWDVMAWLGTTATVPVSAGAPPWLAMDERCRVFVNEAVARRGADVTLRQAEAAAAIAGFPVSEPDYALGGTQRIFAQLRGGANPRTTTNYDFTFEPLPPQVVTLLQRSIHEVPPPGLTTRVYAPWFNLWMHARWLLTLLYLAGLVRLCAAGRAWWPLLPLALLPLANMVGVPVMTFAAEYRYGAPFYPLLALAASLGLARSTK